MPKMRVPFLLMDSGRGTSTQPSNTVVSGTSPWGPILLSFAVALLGSGIYASAGVSSNSWTPVLGSLYRIPVIIAGILLGLRPALAVAGCAGLAVSRPPHSPTLIPGSDL